MINLLEIVSDVFSGFLRAGGFVLSLWWVYVPIFLFIMARDFWLKYSREKYKNTLEWTLLEIVPPHEIFKTPQAMEQFFAGLHGTQSTPNWQEKYIKGQFQDWFSCEIVSIGGQIHFYIRTLARFRDLVEANIYAQYPEAEIYEAADYVYNIPPDAPNKDFDLWGTELILAKEDAYPIKTYINWEKDMMLEEKRIDPLSGLLEVMARIKQGEQIWIQILIRPVMDSWKKEVEKLKDKLLKRKTEAKPGLISKEITGWQDAIREVSGHLIIGEPATAPGPKKEEKQAQPSLMGFTKAEQEIVLAIEANVAKIGYETIIRFIYLGKKEIFDKANVSAVIGAYKQYGTQNLNSLKPNSKISTRIDYKFQLKTVREISRKKKVLKDYQNREFVLYSREMDYLKPLFYEKLPLLNNFFMKSKPFIFNIEELATVFHFPGKMTKAPLVPRIEAKKGEPPSGLPME